MLDIGHLVLSQWKKSVISPIKKGSRFKKQASNYHPVSLTSILCKLFASIIREAIMMKHMLDNNLLTNKQFGFMKCR